MENKNFLSNMQDLLPSVNDTPYKRILAIGDVHGRFTRLMDLWEKISVTADDLVIFLGDYVEGGNENLKVLSWLIEQNEKDNIVILCGNVDDMLFNAFTPNFISYMGEKDLDTLKELVEVARTDSTVTKKVHHFIEKLPFSYVVEISGRDYIFCHGGINPKISFAKQTQRDLLWSNRNFYTEYEGEAVMVVGHQSPRRVMKGLLPHCEELNTTKPARIPGRNILLMDTSAKEDEGFLSCVNILTGEFWQSNKI